MKKQPYILIGLTSFLFVAFLFRSIFKVLDLEWTSLFQDLEKTEKILFLALMFSLALAFLLVLFWTMVDEISRRRIQANLNRLLAGKDIKSLGDADLDASFRNLSGKLGLLTEAIQKADNQVLVKEEEIVEKERKRIAREIHDTLGHALTGISAGIDAVGVLIDIDPGRAKTQLQSVSTVVRDGIKDVRGSLNKLRPGALEDHTLRDAVLKLVHEYQAISNLQVELTYDWDDVDLDVMVEDTVFRVIQESMTNSVRHGHATYMQISFLVEDAYVMILQDNGVGFDQLQVGYGLKQMRERVSILGGRIEFANRNGFYTRIELPKEKGGKIL